MLADRTRRAHELPARSDPPAESPIRLPIRDHPIRVASLDPDVLVPFAFADYRAGRDPALEAVARLLGRR